MFKFNRKLQKIGNSRYVLVPKAVLEEFGINDGKINVIFNKPKKRRLKW